MSELGIVYMAYSERENIVEGSESISMDEESDSKGSENVSIDVESGKEDMDEESESKYMDKKLESKYIDEESENENLKESEIDTEVLAAELHYAYMAESTMSDYPLENPLLNVRYDLINNVIHNESTPSFQHFAFCSLAISLWQKYIFDKLDQTSMVNFQCIFEDFDKCKYWFQQIENKILDVIPRIEMNTFFHDNKKLYLPKCFHEKVGETVYVIKNDLVRFSNSLGKLNVFLSSEIIKRYIGNIHLTLRGTVNFRKTALSFIENSHLKALEKYAIACYYCLKENIYDLLEKLPNNFINNYHKNKNFLLMVFWTYHLQKKDYEFDCLLDQEMLFYDRSGVEYVMHRSIEEGNDVAVQFLWRYFNFKLDIPTLVSYAVNSKSVNLLCYLLSRSIYREDIYSICINDGNSVLLRLVNDSRWVPYFHIASTYVLENLDYMKSYTVVVKTLIVCWLHNKSKRDYYCSLIIEYSQRYNVSVKMFILSSETILKIILVIKDSYSLLLMKLLNIESNNDMRRLFFNQYYLFKLIDSLFEARKLELLEDFIKEIATGITIEEFKYRFVEKFSPKLICLYILKCENFEKMADTVFTLFCGENGLENFKRELPFKKEGIIVGNILESKCFNKMSMIDKFLNWCLNGNEKRVVYCKENLFTPEDNSYRYCSLQFEHQVRVMIYEPYFQPLKEFLNWASSAFSVDIIENFYEIHEIIHEDDWY